MEIKFSDLAVVGLRHLFPEEWRRISVQQHLALSLRNDPAMNAVALEKFRFRSFWIRPFFAGIEIRVLFEWDIDIIIWSVTSARAP